MTTFAEATVSPARKSDVVVEKVTFRRVLSSEFLKFVTLRSTVAVLAAAFLGMIVIALLVGYNTRHLTANLQADDLVPSATLQGYYLGQLLVGALGILFVSGEYSTGMIRSTLAAVPKRLPVLAAKTVVLTVVSAVTMIIVSFLAFLAAQALLSHYRAGWSLSDPGVLRVVIGTGVYLVLITLFASAIAWIVRSTPGSLVAYVALILVIPLLLRNVLGSAGKHIAEFLPTSAGASFSTSIHDAPSLGPWTGLGVMALWVVGALGVAVVALLRRDA